MAHDERIATAIRELLDGHAGVTEKRMFGGLAFLVDGHMAVAASGQGGLLVRVDPDEADELIRTTGATRMVMRGRPMRGWLRVEPALLDDDGALVRWVATAAAYTRSLSAGC